MQPDYVLTPVPLDQLEARFAEVLDRKVQSLLAALSHQQPQASDGLFTRDEAAKFLKVSLVTLNEWTKEGIVKGYRIGSRVRYKESELRACLSQIKTALDKKAA